MTDVASSFLSEPNVLVSASKLHERVGMLAAQIDADHAGHELDFICLTNAAIIFTADLMRAVACPSRMHLLSFQSYSPPSSSGEVRILQDVGASLAGKHVILVEGMVISGRTPLYLMNMLRLRQPASLQLCVIGSKPDELTVDLPISYRLFTFGREWVAGYGIGSGLEKASPDLLDMREQHND